MSTAVSLICIHIWIELERVNLTCFGWISKPSFHLILNNRFQFLPLSSACGLSNQSLPVSYWTRYVHAVSGSLIRMLDILFLSTKILEVAPLTGREKTLKHTPRTTWEDPVGSPCPWAFPVPAFPIDCPFLTFTRSSMFCHPLKSSQRVRISLLIHHLVRILVHVVNIQSIQFWKMSVFPGSRQHVKALFRRVRRGGRKTSLACMEH